MVCSECGGYFTPAGLRLHTGSKKCQLRIIAKPMQEKIDAEVSRLKDARKTPIMKNVATAIERRGLEELCGLEIAETKLFQTDLECKILQEYWVHDWVKRLWAEHNKAGYTRRAYAMLKDLNQLDEDELDSELGLLFLRLYTNG